VLERQFLLLFAFGLGVPAALVAAACSNDPVSTTPSQDASRSDDGSLSVRDARADAPTNADAPASTLCDLTKTFTLACSGSLTCGDAGFDLWCASNDSLINSRQFRDGQRQCLVAPRNCNSDLRNDCQYRTYASQARSTAQQKVVDDYCATCFTQDVAGCKQRSVAYDPDAGPASVPDIFVAAWELGDTLTTDIDTKCTGAALDGGPDASCDRAFADCAGGLYIDRLPNCP
jgi:hypothetical protein